MKYTDICAFLRSILCVLLLLRLFIYIYRLVFVLLFNIIGYISYRETKPCQTPRPSIASLKVFNGSKLSRKLLLPSNTSITHCTTERSLSSLHLELPRIYLIYIVRCGVRREFNERPPYLALAKHNETWSKKKKNGKNCFRVEERKVKRKCLMEYRGCRPEYVLWSSRVSPIQSIHDFMNPRRKKENGVIDNFLYSIHLIFLLHSIIYCVNRRHIFLG